MNDAELLEKYRWAEKQDHLRQQGLPSEWLQGFYLTDVVEGSQISERLNGYCGTACCFAGKTVLDAGWRYLGSTRSGSYVISAEGQRGNTHDVAAGILGLSDADADDLFDAFNTLTDLRDILTDWGVFDRMGEAA